MKRGLLNGSKFLCSKEIDPRVWGLFAQMKHNDKVVENALEIIGAAQSGGIDLNRAFNLFGYDFAINKNKKLKAITKLGTETFIDFSNSQSENYQGGIDIDTVSFEADALDEAKNEYEYLFDNAELRSAIECIQALNDDFIVEYSVDLIGLIKQAVKGVQTAVSKLKEVCSEMPCVAEQVKIILSSKVPIDECF